MFAGSLHSILLSERQASVCICVRACACVSALRMTEGFWQNEVTLFYQVNLCGGGQDKELCFCVYACVCVCVCVFVHICMYGLVLMSENALHSFQSCNFAFLAATSSSVSRLDHKSSPLFSDRSFRHRRLKFGVEVKYVCVFVFMPNG